MRIVVKPRESGFRFDVDGFDRSRTANMPLRYSARASITDGTKMFFFYRRQEPTDKDRFETAAAIRAGIAVGNELRRH